MEIYPPEIRYMVVSQLKLQNFGFQNFYCFLLQNLFHKKHFTFLDTDKFVSSNMAAKKKIMIMPNVTGHAQY